MEGRTYRYFRGEPLYPFGFGLSYTTFEYSGVAVSKSAAGAKDRIDVSVNVKNVGKVAGDEVVQLYVRRPGAGPQGAVRTLRGLSRVHLAAGATTKVRFTLVPEKDMTSYDEARRALVAAPGTVEIEVGASSRDLRGKAIVKVK
jgi:beta-glucosidase